MFEKRVFMISFFICLSQLSQRTFILVFLEIIYNAAGGNPVGEPQDSRTFIFAVGYQMDVIGHYDINKDEKSAGYTGFIEGIDGYLLHFVGLKNGQAFVSHRS